MDFTPFVLADLSFQMKWENLKGNNDYKNKNTEKTEIKEIGNTEKSEIQKIR